METRYRTPAILVAGLICAAIGCIVMVPEIVPGRSAFFDHRSHVEEEEMSCTDCHPEAEEHDTAGMPSVRQCRLCHSEEEEEDVPEGRRISDFYVHEEATWSSVTRLSDEIHFSHQKHYEADVECESCHGNVGASHAVSLEFRTQKDTCLTCHAEREVSRDCKVCHSVVSRDWKPANHGRFWKEMHGQVVRAGPSEDLNEQCSLCHEESTCVQCHLDEPPRNHTNFWRVRGHAIDARVDRRTCMTCHRSDFCIRCHEDAAPQSHTGAWGSPLSIHCLGCHTPIRNVGCFVCHKGTPSHAFAAPQPMSHTPGQNCRQCHGLTAPLPHVDNGDNCAECHP